MALLAPAASTASRPITEQARILQSRFREDWRFFYHEALGGTVLWEKQHAIWDSVLRHMYTLVTSGHATGKDYIIGRLVPWFLFSFSPSIVITTAPTDRQVEKIIWGEIHAAAARAKVELGGRLLEKEWTIADKYYAIGFTSKDTQASSQHFQGFHEANVLIVLSEAPGIHESVWEALPGLTTGEHVRVLAVGQAIGEVGAFYDAYRSACPRKLACDESGCELWHHIKISSWEAAEARERLGIPGLASRKWCEGRLKKWTEQSPLYVSRVLGEFPEMAGDRIIALAWAARAQTLELSMQGACGMGIDPAWRGEDESAISVVRGQRLTRLETYSGIDTPTLVAKATRVVREEREAYPEQPLHAIAIDVGYNPGAYDYLLRSSEELRLSVIGVNFGESADRNDEYVNKSAEMWWRLREELRVGTFQLLPPLHPESEELLAELTSRTVAKQLDKLGRIGLETKQDMRKRGVHSPDRVDSLLMAREAQRHGASGGSGLVVVGEEGLVVAEASDGVNWQEFE